ncbi:MAG: cell division protein FtsQ/DivIB [Prolixibacteraceae bacterium]
MTKKIILKISGLLALLIFIGVTLSFITIERKQISCKNVLVTFSESEQFITPESIKLTINRRFKNLYGTLLDTLNTEIIEIVLEKNPWVKEAEVFKGYGPMDSSLIAGGIRVHIIQEKPFFRVIDGSDGFYVTEEGKHLPFSSSSTINVIVVTGQTSDKYINGDLIKFIKFISDDEFWKAQIQQIHIRKDHELVLVPRVGDQLILFGKPEKMELRFRNLKALYTEGFSTDGWNKYKTITLKYDNQVVCTLK